MPVGKQRSATSSEQEVDLETEIKELRKKVEELEKIKNSNTTNNIKNQTNNIKNQTNTIININCFGNENMDYIIIKIYINLK